MPKRTIIIGAGPAGLFCSLALIEAGFEDIVVIEQGKDLKDRILCKEKGLKSGPGQPSPLLAGFGGAGAFSDGKLTVSGDVGGSLNQFLDESELKKLLRETDDIYLSLGAPAELYGTESEGLSKLRDSAQYAGLRLIETKIRHLGTEICISVLDRLREKLLPHIDLRVETVADEIIAEKGKVKGVKTTDGAYIEGEYVVAAPGRVGAAWMTRETKKLALTSIPSPVDIGVRVEVPAAVTKEWTDAAYEPKLIYYSKTFDDKVRTFCMNPYGEVVLEHAGDLLTVNGHSYRNRKSENTNFALLVSTIFTQPFDNPISYGRHISALANLLGNGVIIQRLGDLQKGRRSTAGRIKKSNVRPTLLEATPGDLSFVLPYRYLKDIMEMLETLEKMAPGINSPHTLLYGVEVKFYSHRLKLSKSLETEIENLFAAGDGAGITRGLLQASASGLIAGREIASRSKIRNPSWKTKIQPP